MRQNRRWRRAGLWGGLALVCILTASLSACKTSTSQGTAPSQGSAASAATPGQSSSNQTSTGQSAGASSALAKPGAESTAQPGVPATTTGQGGAATEGTEQAPAAPAATPAPGQAAPAESTAAPESPGGTAGAPPSSEEAEPQAPAGPIGWGQDFRSWLVVTGYVLSPSHGNRLVQTYVTPDAAVKVYKHNSELALMRKTAGFEDYPPGTKIAMESWTRNAVGGPGKPGPVFFMRKRGSDYDPDGSNWEYGFTRSDLSLIGTGHAGKMQFCKDCHEKANDRDFVWAVRR